MLRDKRTLSIAILAVLTLALCVRALLPGGAPLSVTVMDVGEGLCVVMRTPGGRTMVMDCGTSSWRSNEGVGEIVVLPYLKQSGVRYIDVAVLSHPHEDHLSGYAGLLDRCPARMVIDGGSGEKSEAYQGFLRAVRRCRANYRIAERGQVLDMGEGVLVQVLSPGPEFVASANDRSIVLRVVYGKTAFVLTGDADAATEADVLQSVSKLSAQMLQVGHHGSSGASTPEWLAAVKPTVAVISCGRGNIYGHPARETLDRLASCGARVYRTDKDGAVTFLSDGSTVRVTSVARH